MLTLGIVLLLTIAFLALLIYGRSPLSEHNPLHDVTMFAAPIKLITLSSSIPDREPAALLEENSQLQKGLDHLSSELEQVKAVNDTQTQTILELRDQIQKHDSATQDARNQQKKSDESLAQTVREKEQLQEKHENLNTVYQQASAQVDKLKAAMKEKELIIGSKAEDLEQLRKRHLVIQESLHSAQKFFIQNPVQKAFFESRIKKLEDNLAAKEESIAQIRAELEEELANQVRILAETKASLEEKTRECVSIREQFSSFRHTYVVSHTGSCEINSLQEQLESANRAYSELQQEKTALDKRACDQELSSVLLRRRYSELKSKYVTMKSNWEVVQDEVKSIEFLKTRCENLQSSIATKDVEITRLTTKKDALKQKLAHLKVKQEDLQKDHDGAQEALEAARQARDQEVQRREDELHAQAGAHEQALYRQMYETNQKMRQIGELNGENFKLTTEVDFLEGEVARAYEDSAADQERIERLEEQAKLAEGKVESAVRAGEAENLRLRSEVQEVKRALTQEKRERVAEKDTVFIQANVLHERIVRLEREKAEAEKRLELQEAAGDVVVVGAVAQGENVDWEEVDAAGDEDREEGWDVKSDVTVEDDMQFQESEEMYDAMD